MINSLSKNIVKFLIGRGTVPQGNEALYVYGLFLAISTALFFALAIFVGAFLGLLTESIIFLISFSLIRMFSGGYHSKYEWLCELTSSIAIIAVMLLLKFLKHNPINTKIIFLFSLIAVVTIVTFSPIESDNKKLSDKEKKLFKLITSVIALSEVTVMALSPNSVSSPIFISLIYQSILVLLAIINRKIKNIHD